MYPAQVIEKPYSKEQLKKIRNHFKELEKARHSQSVQEYVKKVNARLKA
ncbi:MAG: hypothetical protein HY392_05635 [Candidatus Diapherotrites archaeon]|nr:hypothetical protein [Candidatus Diapherotrites archaeon]